MTTFTTEDRIAAYSTPQHWPLDHPIMRKCEMCAIKIREMDQAYRDRHVNGYHVDDLAK